MAIDFGLALSIALSVLILMVGLWIQKPLEFSAFPTVLLVATILRLALNISTTRLILSRGAEGPTAPAGRRERHSAHARASLPSSMTIAGLTAHPPWSPEENL